MNASALINRFFELITSNTFIDLDGLLVLLVLSCLNDLVLVADCLYT